MKQRTEDEIMRKAPLEVTLGKKCYSIPILASNPSRVWRAGLVEACQGILSGFSKEVDAKAMAAGLTSALVRFPEKVADLVFAYDTSLPKDEILDEASEEQIAAAFSAIMAVAYPFVPQLSMVIQVLNSQSR